ncbi:MAG TPA: alpha/beta hydrolase [Cyclobacteriaceae bacterium]
MKFNRYSSILFLTLVVALSSCRDNEVKPANEVLVSSQSILIRTAGELRTILGISGINLPIASLQFDVEIYKVTYKTKYLNDQDITASGLVILPKTSGSYPMVSFQHGTIAAHSQAPSVLALSSTELILYAALSSPGFITAVPDLIGFGSSSSVMHPYYVQDLTASAVTDLLKAANELAREKSIEFNEKLFLAGYSQGGYATMAAHKAIEKDGLDDFELIASFPASGGYDVKGMQEYFFALDTYNDPFYLGYVAMAYKSAYSWTPSLSDFFKEPYATRVPTLYDGSKSGSQINAQLTTTIKDLVSSDLLVHIDTDTKYKYIADAFILNSLTDWKPTKKMFMYHGDADVTVPYVNSVVTYNKLIANGASASVISLTTLPGATHGTGVIPYVEDFIPKMLALK